jgi:hypothetical protein
MRTKCRPVRGREYYLLAFLGTSYHNTMLQEKTREEGTRPIGSGVWDWQPRGASSMLDREVYDDPLCSMRK